MPSIGVLEHYQKPTDKPTRRIKRSGGQSYVNQGKAEWVIRNVLLKMRAPQVLIRALQDSSRTLSARKSFIPDKLPPNIDTMLGIIVVGIPRKVSNPEEIRP